jgi:hypothetical protein
MDIPSIKWHRISPGWYQAELESPAGKTEISIERRTRFRIYVCKIKYPDGTEWSCDHGTLEAAKVACEWELQQSIKIKLGWKATDHTETIQRITIYPTTESNSEEVVESLKEMGFCDAEIRVLRYKKCNEVDRVLAYRDDTATDIPVRLDYDNPQQIRHEIWRRVGYVRIDLDVFKKDGETIKGPSIFDWRDASIDESQS